MASPRDICTGLLSPGSWSGSKKYCPISPQLLENQQQGIFSACVCINVHTFAVLFGEDFKYNFTQNCEVLWQHLLLCVGLYKYLQRTSR